MLKCVHCSVFGARVSGRTIQRRRMGSSGRWLVFQIQKYTQTSPPGITRLHLSLDIWMCYGRALIARNIHYVELVQKHKGIFNKQINSEKHAATLLNTWGWRLIASDSWRPSSMSLPIAWITSLKAGFFVWFTIAVSELVRGVPTSSINDSWEVKKIISLALILRPGHLSISRRSLGIRLPTAPEGFAVRWWLPSLCCS